MQPNPFLDGGGLDSLSLLSPAVLESRDIFDVCGANVYVLLLGHDSLAGGTLSCSVGFQQIELDRQDGQWIDFVEGEVRLFVLFTKCEFNSRQFCSSRSMLSALKGTALFC